MKFASGCFAVAGFLVFSATVAEGCGDLLVSLGRGVRFQRAYFASHQATVAVLWNNSASGAVLANPKLQRTLREIGHKVVFVQDSTQLGVALKAGKVDVVLADFTDTGSIAPEVRSASNTPILVPVLYKPSKTEWTTAQRQYPFLLKASADEIQFLTAIDEAMKSRTKTGGKS
jgi:ABC-type amino acid transport substrate-binding protein